MLQVEALPFVHSLARSDSPADRALFVRIYRDLVAELSRRREAAPESWTADLQACLARARPPERDLYLTELAKAYLINESRRPPRREAEPEEGVETLMQGGDLEPLIAVAADPKARLKPEHVAALARRARQALTETGDRRLAEALLARHPLRLEAAPLFLEATPPQREALMLAAQRAELSRKQPAMRPLDPELAGRLEFAAIAGKAEDFAAALAEALGAAPELAERIAADRDGEPLAVALVALGAPHDLSVRVMTARDLSEEGDGFARIHTLARLGDRLSAPAARRLVAAMIGREPVARTAAPAATPRQPATPSPYLRREGATQKAVSRETTATPASARNSRGP